MAPVFAYASLQRAKQLPDAVFAMVLAFAAEERQHKRRGGGRALCKCFCGAPHCGRRPAKGNRFECRICHAMVGKGCCYNERQGVCHRCVIIYAGLVLPCEQELS